MAEGVIVVPDADTLFGSVTRAFLIQLHYAGVIRLRWSATLLTEMSRALVRTGRMTSHQAEAHEQRLRAHLVEAELPESEIMARMAAASLAVRSAKDAHVAACALAAQQGVRGSGEQVVHLVSKNLKDFRARELRALHVQLMHPDLFLSELFRVKGQSVAEAFADFRRQLRSREPADSLLIKLAKDGQVVTASMLSSAAQAGDIDL